ncbi:MAG: leucine-rich repeat domain-containing protein [Bacteroides uniformis]
MAPYSSLRSFLCAVVLGMCVASCAGFTDELPLPEAPDTPAATEDLTGQPIQIGNIAITANSATTDANADTRTLTNDTGNFLVEGRTMTVFMFSPTGTDGATVCHHANYVYTSAATPGAPSTTTASWQLQPGSDPLCWQSSGDEHRFYAISPATDTPNANILTDATDAGKIIGFTPAIYLPTAWTADSYEEWGQLRITPIATAQTPRRDVPISLNLGCPLVRVQIVSDASRITLRQVNALSPTTENGEAGKSVMEMYKDAGLMYGAYILPGATEISYLTDSKAKKSNVSSDGLKAGEQVQIMDVDNSNVDVAVVEATAGNLNTLLGSVGEKKKIVITGKIEDADMESLETFVKDKSITDLCILATGVTSIGSKAFYGCTSLASISLPQGVTSIGKSAFENCTSLASISLPQGITSIEYSTFNYCKSLASISLPQGLTSIGESTFAFCTSLASISLPQGVTSIGEDTFWSCSSLASISLPQGVTSIGESTFYGCTSLASISLPQSLTSIEKRAFGNCPKLEDIVLSGCDFNVPSGFFLPATTSDIFYQSSPVTLFLRDVPAAMFSANAAACQSWGGVSWKAIHYDYNGPDDELYHTDAARYSGHWTAP